MTEDKYCTNADSTSCDDVIPLDQIGKIGTVKVYTQAYIDKFIKQLTEKDKQIADLEQEKCELLGIIQGKDKVIAQTKELLKRVIGWADWQSGSKCPSFQEIEKDIKAFLEEK